MNQLKFGLCILALLTTSIFAKADSLTGTTVAGSLVFTGLGPYNDFSTAGGKAPVNATVGPQVEFTETMYVMEDSANFSANGLAVTIDCVRTAGQCSGSYDYPFTMTFTDTAFSDFTLSTLTNNIGLAATLSGDTLTLKYTGLFEPQGSTVSTFGFVPDVAATPEPGSLVLLGTGLLGAVAMLRRRMAA